MPRRLPKNVVSETTRHGKTIYYFRRDGARVRLPEPDHANFKTHYEAARSGSPVPHVRDMPPTVMALRRQKVEATLASCLRAARGRSRRRGLPFSLTLDGLLAVAKGQDFRCLLTGIEFFAEPPARGKVDPYAPSIDRIEPAKGYVPENTRIVIRAVNLMLLDWGPAVFEQVANSYRYWQGNERRKSMVEQFNPAGRTLETV